jgi:predicted ATPase
MLGRADCDDGCPGREVAASRVGPDGTWSATTCNVMKRVVVTGGPGAGKTASLEVARQSLCAHVGFAPESASIVFGGGFPREMRERAECAAQRAIFHVQRELESLFEDRTDFDLLLCDRGTVDCAAYWPHAESEFYRELGTTHAAELARYAAVIHLRPPPKGDGYERKGLRIESAEQALRIDARIERAWCGHPRRFFVEHTHDFFAKVGRVLAIVQGEISCAHASARSK